MLARTHVLSGACACAGLGPALGVHDPLRLLAMAIAGGGAALLADLDHHSGTASKTWGPITRVLGFWVGRITGGHRQGTHTVLAAVVAAVAVYFTMGAYPYAALPLVALMVGLCLVAWEDLIPGRKWERLWPANLAASFGIAGALLSTGLADGWLPVAVGVGWLAHVVGDAMTVGGVRPWMPLSDAKLRLSRLRTGGRVLGFRWEPAAQGGFGVATVALLMIGIR
jgi:membrane-bound metal-dependent hydrolase YbcI (DUF457 family)